MEDPKQNELNAQTKKMQTLLLDLDENINEIVRILKDLTPPEMLKVISKSHMKHQDNGNFKEIWKLTANAKLGSNKLSILEGALLGPAANGTRVVDTPDEIDYFKIMLVVYIESTSTPSKEFDEYALRRANTPDISVYRNTMFCFGEEASVKVRSYFQRNVIVPTYRQLKWYPEEWVYFFAFSREEQSDYQKTIIAAIETIVKTEACMMESYFDEKTKSFWVKGTEMFANRTDKKIYNHTPFRLVYRIVQIPKSWVKVELSW